MTNNQNADPAFDGPVDERVGKDLQRVDAALVVGHGSELRVLNEESGYAFELVQEPPGEAHTALRLIEPNRLREVEFRPTM